MVKHINVIDKEGQRVLKEVASKEKKEKELYKEVQLSGIGYYLVVPLLAGLFAGVFIDNKFATKPIFTIIGLLIGVSGTFYNLIKIKKITE